MEFSIIQEGYEGPFDIFITLIDKKKMNIRNFNISLIIDDYLEYTKSLKLDDLQIRAEFLSMASRLIKIKSMEVLNTENSRKEKEILKQEIIDYSLIKKLSKKLKTFEKPNIQSYSINEIKTFHNVYDEDNSSLSIENLKKALINSLKKMNKEKEEKFLTVNINRTFNYKKAKEDLLKIISKQEKNIYEILIKLKITDKFTLVSFLLLILEEYKQKVIDILVLDEEVCLKTL